MKILVLILSRTGTSSLSPRQLLIDRNPPRLLLQVVVTEKPPDALSQSSSFPSSLPHPQNPSISILLAPNLHVS
ncbi:hypothetical protein L207DRAFT_511189 [Hyaloscypha variabilis F]|uniref:Uncharacterized protein n=1 Tax=Hyaloscypha variabilis (strain UAMH 11265 / GT02V1 / F) TaxID=1149755 RepID=A0A2J6RRZ5_HYAVF|nr:hypothetical protein L207DRAFT_511189 [Hyaloscypha variabilis F]